MAGVAVDRIISEIARLSPSERATLYRRLATSALREGQMDPTACGVATRPTPIPEPDPEPNLRWIEAHKTDYAGQWVALDGDRLISAADTEREVANAARLDGAYLPLIVYLPHPDEPAFVGL